MTPESKEAQKESKRAEIRAGHPDSWIAVEIGDTLRGQVIAADNAWSDVRRGPDGEQGAFYPLLTVQGEATGYDPKNADGEPVELKLHAFGAVLYNEVMKLRPEIGERITVRYLGTGEAKVRGQNPPELYRLTVEGRTDMAASAYKRIDGDVEKRGVGSTDRTDVLVPDPELPADGAPGEDVPF